MPLRRRVDAVRLVQVRHACHALHEEGQEGDVQFAGQLAEEPRIACGVFLPVVGKKIVMNVKKG